MLLHIRYQPGRPGEPFAPFPPGYAGGHVGQSSPLTPVQQTKYC